MLERVRPVRERLERDDALQPIAISADECAALTDWVRREGARRTIEVGLAYGLSALAICEGLLANGGGHHVALDPFQSTAILRTDPPPTPTPSPTSSTSDLGPPTSAEDREPPRHAHLLPRRRVGSHGQELPEDAVHLPHHLFDRLPGPHGSHAGLPGVHEQRDPDAIGERDGHHRCMNAAL